MSGIDERDDNWGEGGALATLPDDWAAQVHRFWFVDHGEPQWFGGGAAFDTEVAAALAPWREALRHRPVEAFLTDTQTALAAVILFDQVPRNVHRGTAEAFATDDAALAIAKAAVAAGMDDGLSVDERLFLYLPFEHSEQIDDQLDALRLIGGLGRSDLSEYAQKHFEVIKRFGRFPHRNAALGRADRPGEAEAVAAGAHW